MHIALAVDGSPSSVHARDLVASLPWPPGTTVTLLTAYDIPVAWFTEGMTGLGDWLPAVEEALRQEADQVLTEMAAPLQERGWAIERRVLKGRAANVIQTAADEVDADLIVLGSRGHGPIVSMLLGSVSAEVADQAGRSVLVARGGAASRLLVATDGSECSRIIPSVLAEWGSFRDLPAVAVSVAPVDSPAFELMVSLYTLGNDPLQRQREELLERHREYAATMAQGLAEIGIQAQSEVRPGDAAHEIIKAAAAWEADLIVTGSRCLRGLDRWFLGSVARNVLLHADASVLVVRRKGQATGS